jgi:hypothetical protein
LGWHAGIRRRDYSKFTGLVRQFLIAAAKGHIGSEVGRETLAPPIEF